MSVSQLPTPEPTPAVKTGNRQLSVERKLAAEVSVSDRLVRVPDAIVREALARADLRKPVASVYEEEEEESARGGIRDEDQIFSGPWVSKGNPTGFLDCDDEEVVDQMGRDWWERRMRKMMAGEWEDVAGFLLTHAAVFVDSELVESEQSLPEFDLILRILGEDGSVDWEDRDKISDAYFDAQRELGEFQRKQDKTEDKLEARDKLITGHGAELQSLTERRDTSDLELLLTVKTQMIDMFVAQADRLKEKLEAAERKAEEKWKAWAEKEAHFKAGKAVSAERKKW